MTHRWGKKTLTPPTEPLNYRYPVNQSDPNPAPSGVFVLERQMTITARLDASKLAGKLRSIATKARNAGNDALNAAGKASIPAVQHEMRDVFDRPTPYTLNSFGLLKRAGSNNSQILLGLKTDTSKGTSAKRYLAAQITGGERHQKRFEKALQAAGAMPTGYRAMPGSGCPLDSYGNIPPSFIVQLLSYFRAFPEAGYRANMTDKRRAALAKGNAKKNVQGVAYFVGRPGDRLPLGIYARYKFAAGSAIKPILIFVEWARYQERFDFQYVAEASVRKTFPGHFKAALAAAGLNA